VGIPALSVGKSGTAWGLYMGISGCERRVDLSPEAPQQLRVAEQSLAGVAGRLADPQQPAGGGVAAAATLALAAATAELVATLSLRRKSVQPHRAEVEEIRDRLGHLQTRFLAAADEDIAVLSDLLEAHRAARPSAGVGPQAQRAAEEALQRSLTLAAETPITLAQDGLALLRLVLAAVPFAARFTVSDLGAAAALAQGAIEAALLMSEVNLGLLPDATRAAELRTTVDQIREEAPALARQALDLTRAKMSGKPMEEGLRGDRT